MNLYKFEKEIDKNEKTYINDLRNRKYVFDL